MGASKQTEHDTLKSSPRNSVVVAQLAVKWFLHKGSNPALSKKRDQEWGFKTN